MHDTIVKMKDGREFCGIIQRASIEDDYMILYDYSSSMGHELYWADMESAITKEDRISVTEIGDRDEIAAHVDGLKWRESRKRWRESQSKS